MSAKPKAARSHPVLNAFLRRRLVVELHKAHGMSIADARQMTADLDDEEIDSAVEQTEGAKEAVGAIGDGSLLQKLIDFISSPQGQALIALLIKLILGGA